MSLKAVAGGGSGGGGGTVTSVSVASANGFAGTVANPTSTPAISVSTSVTGLLKGNGTAVSAAASGTDYAPATSGSALLAGNGAGGFATPTAATIGAPIVVVTTAAVTPASATPVSSGLSVIVTSGATYSYEIYYYIMNSATANVTLSLNFGSATMTSVIGEGTTQGAAGNSISQTAITGYASTINNGAITGVQTYIYTQGTFVVNSGGTFIPGVATANASTSSLLVGSWMRLTRIS